MQRKLSIGASNDPLEAEADRVADQVMRMPAHVSASSVPPKIRRYSASPETTRTDVPESVDRVLAASGSSLDAGTRYEMEQRFGQDFSRVRVHTDANAAQSAHDVGATAYTVGNHIAFATGRYAPSSNSGARLLAHELTHALQQTPLSNPFSAATLRRAPMGTKPAAPMLDRVVVDQASKQKIVATFSDGSALTDECSTGKGHCCFDASAGSATGGACSASGSNLTDNNCTPVGTFKVTAKIPLTHGGIEFWTQFHNAKMVALHNYDPAVTGEPLSHGCVRLHKSTAEKIFNGAVIGKTLVEVKNLARPLCDDAQLLTEWRSDFINAGKKPPDGTMINPDTGKKYTKKEMGFERADIEETRKDLKSALGIGDKGLDAELAKLKPGLAMLDDDQNERDEDEIKLDAELAKPNPKWTKLRSRLDKLDDAQFKLDDDTEAVIAPRIPRCVRPKK